MLGSMQVWVQNAYCKNQRVTLNLGWYYQIMHFKTYNGEKKRILVACKCTSNESYTCRPKKTL